MRSELNCQLILIFASRIIFRPTWDWRPLWRKWPGETYSYWLGETHHWLGSQFAHFAINFAHTQYSRYLSWHHIWVKLAGMLLVLKWLLYWLSKMRRQNQVSFFFIYTTEDRYWQDTVWWFDLWLVHFRGPSIHTDKMDTCGLNFTVIRTKCDHAAT